MTVLRFVSVMTVDFVSGMLDIQTPSSQEYDLSTRWAQTPGISRVK